MKKILISLMAILLLSACDQGRSVQSDQSNIAWNDLKLSAVAKCNNIPIPPPGACANNDPITVLINVDANGAPVSVAPIIESCNGKQVTWKYAVNVANPAQFFIVFNPAQFPGNSTYDPVSIPLRDRGDIVNQTVSINTRAKRGASSDPSECMNYLIVVPDKGILDPVLIIKY